MTHNQHPHIAFLEELNRTIMTLIPAGLFILDPHLTIVSVNRAYCDICRKKHDEMIGKSIYDVLPGTLTHETGLGDILKEVIRSHKPVHLTGLRYTGPGSQSARTLNIDIRMIGAGENSRILLTVDDVSDRVEKIFELSMLRYINEAIAQKNLKPRKILNMILTCVTAGSALGFNRAFLLFVNKSGTRLVGRMGVGPASREDAYRVWAQIGAEQKTLKDMLASSGLSAEDAHMETIINRMSFSLREKHNIVVDAITHKKPYKVVNALMDPLVSPVIRELLGSIEFVVVPMIVRDRAIGAIIADNIYSMVPISEEHVQLLTMFANQAGLVLEIAEMYKKLEQERNKLKDAYRQISVTQEKLLEAERLATIGKMAAYVSHEIRNPLVTIGGFAQTIQRHPEKTAQTKERIKIIVKEVNRLEKILSEVLEFSKPFKPNFQPARINQVINETCVLIQRELPKKKIELQKELAPGLPKLLIDAKQVTQALLNVFKNSIYAMPRGGTITVATERADRCVRVMIKDTGRGIPQELLDKLFTPFFTTKRKGSGLGLAVTDQIVKDHGGWIEVKSEEGKGTTFLLYLPISFKYNDAAITQTEFY